MYIKYIFIFSALLMFASCSDKENIDNSIITKQKEQVFNLLTHDGKIIKISKKDDKFNLVNDKSKIIIIDFWATWCPPCKAVIPHLISLQEKYKDNLKIIGVLQENNKPNSQVQKYIDEIGINYSITNSYENFKLANAFGGITAIPTMFLISQDGKIIEKYQGAIPQEMIENDINKLLNK